MTDQLPEVGQVYYPKTRSLGRYVTITACYEDKVEFTLHMQDEHSPLVNRLSTFLARYERNES